MVLSQNGDMDKGEQYSKPFTEGTPILAAHASFFLLPSCGGEERENTNKQKRTKQTQTHHSHYSGINGKAMGLSTSFLSTAARAMYKKCLSPSVLEVEPDVSGE